MFKTHKNQERLFRLLISPPFPFAPVFPPLWGAVGCCLLPKEGDSFSIVNNVSNWTFGPFFFLQLIQSPVKSSFPLRFPSLKWKQSEVASHWERSFNTFFSFPLRFLFLTPGSILTQYQERQTLPRVIYKRWSNLQTSSKLHRVISSHFSVHFCTFHPGQWIWGSGLVISNVVLSLVLLRFIDEKKKSSLYFPFSFPSVVSRFADTGSTAPSHGDTQAFIVLR